MADHHALQLLVLPAVGRLEQRARAIAVEPFECRLIVA